MNTNFTQVKEALADVRIVTANIIVLLKTVFLGVLLYELFHFSLTFASKINAWTKSEELWYWAIGVGLFCLLILIAYLYFRGIFGYLTMVAVSRRIDLLAALLFGVWVNYIWGGF